MWRERNSNLPSTGRHLLWWGQSPSQCPALLPWAWGLSWGSLSPGYWGHSWKNILGCGGEIHSTFPKPFWLLALDRFELEPRWTGSGESALGEMVFGNILPLSPKTSDYEKPWDPDAGKDRKQEKRGTEDEMVGCLHQCHGLQWTWTWANSGRWWGTGKPGMLQSMGLKESGMTWWLNQQHEKPQILRNTTMIKTKDSEFRSISESSNTNLVHDLGRSSKPGVSVI